MATITKINRTLDVTLVDRYDDKFTYKLNNPKSNVTFADVQAAWANVIDSSVNVSGKQILYSNKGLPFVKVLKVYKTTVTTVSEEVFP